MPSPPPPPGESQIRIVRLSEVQGTVDLDRGNHGFEAAFLNLPVVQGSRLRTGMGLAEVEFEDNSSLRLTPNTEVEFTHLALQRSGSKVSAMRVLRGTVYLSSTDTKGNVLSLSFGKDEVAVPPSTHLELSVGDPESTLRVLNGNASVTTPSGTLAVAKKKSLTVNSSDGQSAPTLADNREPGTYDKWDRNSADYHNARANAAFGSGYGSSDLAYYGSFVNLGGSCGNLWQPYFMGSGWSPWSNGAFAWYQGAGYSWVSPYQWGWTPFHSGSWMNCGAAGWGWQPGAQFYGLQNIAGYGGGNYGGGGVTGVLGGRSGATGVAGLPRPPLPPGAHGTTLVSVSTHPVTPSQNTADGFVFRAGSAGLGVPRQTFGNLNHVATEVNQNGAAVRGSAYSPTPGVVAHTNIAGPAYSSGSAFGGTHTGPPMGGSTSAHTTMNTNTSSAGSLHSSAPSTTSSAPSAGTAHPR